MPMLAPGLKGYPHSAPPRSVRDIGAARWNVLAGDLPFPIALLRREALEHNIAWMQARVRQWGIDFAPHGKTTMSPQLFARQIDAGAWGITFANVTQTAIGVAAGVRRGLIANQVMSASDLSGLQALLASHADLRVLFLVDSVAQLELIEAWAREQAAPHAFEVLIEIGYAGGRTGCRSHDEAVALAARLHASPAVRLVGIESYEGTTQID
ncbi:MAG: amino acid deaminase, partial [Comamonadaceae bacterium]